MTGGGGVASEQRDNWSELPGELLDAIMCRLTKATEVIYFRAVCKPWRRPSIKLRQSLPWLRCSYIKKPDCCCAGENCHHFIDLARRSNDKIRRVDLPESVEAKGACGSASGWMLIPTKPWISDEYFLLEPFTGNKICLPPIRFYLFYSIACFAMSADPMTTEECIVMVPYHGYPGPEGDHGLAFCKLGSKQQQEEEEGGGYWTSIPFPPYTVELIQNIVFWKDRFHVICWDGEILVCDLEGPHPTVSRAFLISDQIWSDPAQFSILVSPEGELMLVIMHKYDHQHEDLPAEYAGRFPYDRDIAFTVYKMKEDKQIWDEVQSIGDYALFVCGFNAVYVSTKDHPECRKNRVYYELAAYDISSKRLESFCSHGTLDNVFYTWNCSSWIFPSV